MTETKSSSAVDCRQIWRSADAVCLDVDSTVVPYEGIDVLADFCGVGKEVAEYTKRAMDGACLYLASACIFILRHAGGVKFETALTERLKLMNVSRKQLDACLKQHPPKLTPGVADLIALLHERKVPVFLVSGGFRAMIEPVAKLLEIPKERIFANQLLFKEDEEGSYAGFDASEPTSKSGGKPLVVGALMKQHGFTRLVAIGDGATDLETRPPAAAFIGFGGVVARQKVKEGADWFVTDFKELIAELSAVSKSSASAS